MIRKPLAFALAAAAAFASSSVAFAKELQPVPELKITINGRAEHPCVYLTREDVARARRNRETRPWAKAVAEQVLADASRWAKYTDDELRNLIPGPDACFAEGFGGCPVCGGKTGHRGADGAASLSDPGHLKCVNGHRLPDADHRDPGTGYVDKDGKNYFFVGTYNAFVMEQITSGMTDLVHAYAITGDRVYSDKAAVLLDAVARIYPTCEKGPWDWPQNAVYPLSGRLNRPLYQVARTLVVYVNHYDILRMGDALDTPSVVLGMTKRENVERNLLLNGAKYCYEWSVRYKLLTNGQADYQRGAMAVAAALGIPEYVAWGVDGPFGAWSMLENNIDRDGQYYETSSNYARWTRTLYMDLAEVLRNYTDAAHPDGVRLAEHPKFRAMYVLPQTRLAAAGVTPPMGDDAPNVKRLSAAESADIHAGTDFALLQHLNALRDDPETRGLLARLAAANGASVEEMLARQALGGGGMAGTVKSPVSAGAKAWFLFHATDVDATPTTRAAGPLVNPLTDRPVTASDHLPQRGFTVLRGGGDDSADGTVTRPRAITLRSGPTLNHGHFDSMNLGIFLDRRDMTYDMGYGLSTMHTGVGFARLTAAHNTVLVDEANQLQDGNGGGSIHHFVETPGFRSVRADDARCYSARGVTRYERTVTMIDTPRDTSYALDVFRVVGGGRHDYVFHSQGPGFATTGLEFSPPRPGSVAGPDVDWGARVGVDGDVIGMPNKANWVAPPGNGLGFMMAPRSARPTRAWSAQWSLPDDANLRLTMAPAADAEIVHADAPGIYPNLPRAAYVLVRRTPGTAGSTYAAVIEPFEGAAGVREVTWLAPPTAAADSPVAVKVSLTDDTVDYVLQPGGNATLSAADAGREFTTGGGLLRARFRGDDVAAVDAVGVTRAVAGPMTVTLDRAAYEGSIERLDLDRCVIYTRQPLPEGDTLRGQFVCVNSAPNAAVPYAQQSPYRIASVARDGELTAIHLSPTTFVIGRARLGTDPAAPDALPNIVPLEFSQSLGHKPSGFYRGKRAATADGRTSTTVRDVDAPGMTIRVDDSTGFKAGDAVCIYDVSPGDVLRIPCFAAVRRGENGGMRVTANVTGTIVTGAGRQAFGPRAPGNGVAGPDRPTETKASQQ